MSQAKVTNIKPAFPGGTAPALDRRRALAVVAGALGAASLAPTAAAADPDAELVALGAQAAEADRAYLAAGAHEDDLRMVYWRREPKIPVALRQTSHDFRFLGGGSGTPHRTDREHPKRPYFTQALVDEFRSKPRTKRVFTGTDEEWQALPDGVAGPLTDEEKAQRASASWADVSDEMRQARVDEIIAAWDAWQAECDLLREEVGLTAAEERVQELGAARDDLEEQVIAARATTLQGVMAKAAIVGQVYDTSGLDYDEMVSEEGTWDERIAYSIVRDLLAIRGRDRPQGA